MSTTTILILTICGTAPLTLLIIGGVYLIIFPVWWHGNLTDDNANSLAMSLYPKEISNEKNEIFDAIMVQKEPLMNVWDESTSSSN